MLPDTLLRRERGTMTQENSRNDIAAANESMEQAKTIRRARIRVRGDAQAHVSNVGLSDKLEKAEELINKIGAIISQRENLLDEGDRRHDDIFDLITEYRKIQ